MITKEQAMTCKEFIQTRAYLINANYYGLRKDSTELTRPMKWRANGKYKTWKTRPDEFKLPIKHGLCDYGYITHENAHLFDVSE